MNELDTKYKEKLYSRFKEFHSTTLQIDFDIEDRTYREEFGNYLKSEGIISSFRVYGQDKFECELSATGLKTFSSLSSENQDIGQNSNDASVKNEITVDSKPNEQQVEKKCRKCGASIANGVEYCPKCGTPVKRVCPKCNTELMDDQDYCPKCGTKYTESLKTIEIKNTANTVKGTIGNKKNSLLKIAAVVLLAIGAIFGVRALMKPNFKKMIDHVVAEHPDEPEYEGFLAGDGWDLILTPAVKIGDNGKWMKVDSNPTDTDSDDMLDFQKRHLYYVTDDLIKYTNSQLGFSDLVYEDMQTTTWSMGVQSAESKKATVKWTYHPDKGLEVTYTLK